jgi:hypothetical protein
MSINLTPAQIAKGTLAASMLGKGKSTDSDAREGFEAIRSAIAQGATGADLSDVFGLSKNKGTLAKAVLTLAAVVPADATDDGFTRVITQVNYLSALGMSPVRTATDVVEANPKVGTFNALADLLADITGEGAKGKGGNKDKDPRTLEQDIAALVKRVTVVAETHDTNEAAIMQAVWTALKAAREAAQAA